jgi:hypothetical protein
MIIHSNVEMNKPDIKKSCCSKKNSCDPKKSNKNNEAQRGTCNPFMFCSGCAYVASENPEYAFHPFTSSSVKQGYKPEFYISDFISTLWHPPEFI